MPSGTGITQLDTLRTSLTPAFLLLMLLWVTMFLPWTSSVKKCPMISPSCSSILPFLWGWALLFIREPCGSGSRGMLTQWLSPFQWMSFGTDEKMPLHIEITFEVPEKCIARNAIHCFFSMEKTENFLPPYIMCYSCCKPCWAVQSFFRVGKHRRKSRMGCLGGEFYLLNCPRSGVWGMGRGTKTNFVVLWLNLLWTEYCNWKWPAIII